MSPELPDPPVPTEIDIASSKAEATNPSMVNNAMVPQGTAMAIGSSLLPQRLLLRRSSSTTTATTDSLQNNVPAPYQTNQFLAFWRLMRMSGGGVFVLHRNRVVDRSELDGWLALPTESALGPYEEIQVSPGLSPVLDVVELQFV